MRFEKITLNQWRKDVLAEYYKEEGYTEWEQVPTEHQIGIDSAWENIMLPARSSVGSAGYDFYNPFWNFLKSTNTTKILTGIRWISDNNCFVLSIYPRSGLGCKYGLKLQNTVGIIDSDYWQSDNEGHIMLVMGVNSDLCVDEGKAIAQGIVTQFFLMEDDNACGVRNGGFGSSDEVKTK